MSETHQYRIEHTSCFSYSEPVSRSIVCVHVQPREDHRQKLVSFSLKFDPPASIVPFKDFLGNSAHVCDVVKPHRELLVHSSSTVHMVVPPTLPQCLGAGAWDAIGKIADPVSLWDYLTPSTYVYDCPELARFCNSHGIAPAADPLTSLLNAARTINALFQYQPGSTAVDSPIEQILSTMRGVCQDYSHVLLSIGRNWGIPSRYVSGYLQLEGLAGEQSIAGESHAWTEFLMPGLGWVGIDPTNNTPADHRHVAVAVGRDYHDVPPTRGIEYGGGEAQLSVRVVVKGDPLAHPGSNGLRAEQ